MNMKADPEGAYMRGLSDTMTVTDHGDGTVTLDREYPDGTQIKLVLSEDEALGLLRWLQ